MFHDFKHIFEVKITVVTFWTTFEIVGLLFIGSSGHSVLSLIKVDEFKNLPVKQVGNFLLLFVSCFSQKSYPMNFKPNWCDTKCFHKPILFHEHQPNLSKLQNFAGILNKNIQFAGFVVFKSTCFLLWAILGHFRFLFSCSYYGLSDQWDQIG